jgi:hypothetical protein
MAPRLSASVRACNPIRSMADLFQDSRLKIDRANHHIDDFDLRLRDLAQDTHELTVEFDPKYGCDVIHVAPFAAVPDEFSLILGDALHNLRSALDYQICAIEYAHTRDIGEKTAFPVCETQDELRTAVSGGLGSRIPSAISDFLVETVQPYKGGDGVPIWHLHELEIVDQRRLLIPQFQLSAITGIRYQDQWNMPTVLPEWVVTSRRAVSYRCVGQTGVHITDKGKSAVAVVFGEGVPLARLEILPVLRKLSEFVRETVEKVAAAYFATL